MSRIWRRDWERIRPLFAFPREVRRILYTTNAVESLRRSLRKATKTRGSFPTQEAALNHFEILWPERMAKAEAR